jgi:predicted nucleic acid-binding protein
MIGIDTNVFIYGFDREDPVKHEQAGALLTGLADSEADCVCLWQVACEYLAFLRRQQSLGLLTAQGVMDELEQLFHAYPLICPDESLIAAANGLHRRYSLSHWDSLLLAACLHAGIDTLYSEDMSHGMTYDTVTVINPFKSP